MKREQPSMLKIAQRAGVSAMTVSRVLNHSSAVLPATREKVLRIAQEMGYSHYPNAISRMLRGERSRSIGILTAFARPNLAGELIRRIGQELFPSDYVSYIVNTYADPLVVLRSLQTLAERRTEGVIYFGYNPEEINDDVIRLLRQIGAAVLISHVHQHVPFHQIYCGWDPGVRDAVRYFARRGCTCPILLKESANRSCVQVFESACRECGFKNWEVITCPPRQVESLPDLQRGLPGDAVFCSSEKFRLPAEKLTGAGKKVPLVVLLDDFLISQLCPAYPVLRRREPEAGTLAVKLLLDQINGRTADPATISLPMQFLESIQDIQP